jgi:hypothetical protein
MVRGCFYVAVWVSLIIYFITQHAIDRREEETSYIEGYSNISSNSSAWAAGRS